MAIKIKTKEQLVGMREAGRLAAEVLEMIEPYVQPGVTTDELDRRCYEHIVQIQKTIPANIGYGGGPGRIPFPKTTCTSVNHVVCHGIPGSRVLNKGDIVNIDVTVIKDGFHGDTSRMYVAGEPSVLAKRLIDVTFNAMWTGIRIVKPGANLRDIGRAIQKYVESHRFSVVREYCGHGIGEVYHEDPQVLHYDDGKQNVPLVPGMIFTIEPMVNAGARHVNLLSDGWTVVTKDKSLSAQWEHTVAVTETGFEVLTLLPRDAAQIAA
jgi:methionyl aminopeptidase